MSLSGYDEMFEAMRETGTSPVEKVEQESKKVAEYIRTHVTRIELSVTSWQSQAISGSQNVRGGVMGSHEHI